MEQYPLITILAVGFSLSFILGFITLRFKIPPIIAYLIAGILIGPYTPGLVVDLKLAQEVSGMGIILLMFGVGLQFSLKDLSSVKFVAIPGAILQTIASIIVFFAISYYFLQFSLLASLIFGLAVATPSTVVALKTLDENKLVNTYRGQITIGWLVIGDIAMILSIVIVPSLVFLTNNSEQEINLRYLILQFSWVIIKVIIFIALMLIVGRKLIPYIIRRALAINNQELFTLAIMTIALGIAYFSSKIFGISFALGAFFAGLMVNRSEHSERVSIETLPWRDAFSVLFFVSVGMLFDFKILLQQPLEVLLVVIMVIGLNSLITYLTLTILGKNTTTSTTISSIVGQIGEFSFVIATLGISLGFINHEQNNIIIAGAIISIILNPFIVRTIVTITKAVDDKKAQDQSSTQVKTPNEDNENHIPYSDQQPANSFVDEQIKSRQYTCAGHAIIVGDNYVTSLMQRILSKLEYTSIRIINKDTEIPEDLINCSCSSTIVGDFVDPQIYEFANIEYAKVIYFLVENIYAIENIAVNLLQTKPSLKIVIFTKYKDEYKYFKELGFTYVYYASLELSLDLLIRDNLLDLNQQKFEQIKSINLLPNIN